MLWPQLRPARGSPPSRRAGPRRHTSSELPWPGTREFSSSVLQFPVGWVPTQARIWLEWGKPACGCEARKQTNDFIEELGMRQSDLTVTATTSAVPRQEKQDCEVPIGRLHR